MQMYFQMVPIIFLGRNNPFSLVTGCWLGSEPSLFLNRERHFLLHNVQACSEAHPSFQSKTSFSGGKATEAWSWQLTSTSVEARNAWH
jgi:hypothetical protein